jgi:hypothetical protein
MLKTLFKRRSYTYPLPAEASHVASTYRQERSFEIAWMAYVDPSYLCYEDCFAVKLEAGNSIDIVYTWAIQQELGRALGTMFVSSMENCITTEKVLENLNYHAMMQFVSVLR